MKQVKITTTATVINTDAQQTQYMTSFEIAALTGKPHNDVLKAIRKMEPAWRKVQGGNFSLLQKIYELPNGGKKKQPYFQLTKTECLYIATKFNDEARAKLVLRWEQLEREQLTAKCQQLMLPAPERILQLADHIIGEELAETNKDAKDCLTATQVAKTFNMTVFDFNHVLNDMGIQYRRHGRWNLSDDLAGRDLTRLRTHVSYSLDGKRKVRHYMTWTVSGLHYLNAKLGYPNF